MRTFVAVELDAELKKELAAIQRDLKACGADVRWTRGEGIHLTLKFLGEIRPEDVGGVTAAMSDAVEGIEPFEFEVGGIGAFPSEQSPRVVWIGVKDTSGRLEEISRALDDGLQSLGIGREGRRFKPHLTLGRVRSGRGHDELCGAMAAHRDAQLGRREVDEIVLFQSELTPQGAVYSVVARQPLS